MPITPPNLDDLTYDTIVSDLVRRIPVYAPEWTDHNETDPGIALIELFAHLGEMLGYRLNRVPELAHIELLKLLGVRLQAAQAATTKLAMLLDDPTGTSGRVIRSGLAATATTGDPPPEFTTDVDHDLVPADVGVLLTTKHPSIADVLVAADGTRETPAAYPETPTDESEWLDLRWDGRKPKAKDLPVEPISVLGDEHPDHGYLWLGLRFNPAMAAGFRSTRITLHLFFDDDEQPTLLSIGECAPEARIGEQPPEIDWLHYWDADAEEMRPVGGRIDDSTADLDHSGSIRFTVPAAIGTPASWVPMQAAGTTDPLEATGAFADALGAGLAEGTAISDAVGAIGDVYRQHFRDAVDEALDELPPPPDLDDLLTAIKDELLERFLEPWNFPDLDAIRDQIHQTVLGVLDEEICDADLQGVVDRLSASFLDPLEPLFDAVPAGPFDLADLGADVVDALDGFRDFLLAMDAAAIRNEAQALHAWFRGIVPDELAMAGPLVLPAQAFEDLAGFYGLLAGQLVDAVWAGPLNNAVLSGIATWYRGAALAAIDDALDLPPADALAELAESYADAIAAANEALLEAAAQIIEFVDHPLEHRYRDPARIQGWLRLTVPTSWASSPRRLRHVGFNVLDATNAATAPRSIIGSSNGRPNQQFALGNGNVLAGTIEISVQESVDPSDPLTTWSETDDLAAAGPHARVFDLDREAGVVTFGDGRHGMVPPLVRDGGAIVVGAYRHGGGRAGEVPVGDISKLTTAVPGARDVVNPVAATGGRDAEDLAEAKRRARRELATRHRAVTRSDFEWIAGQTPTVRVGRAVAVGLRRPRQGPPTSPPDARCGPPLPDGPTGLDPTLVAHGAVSVVVVPDAPGPEPLPTPSFLREVCHWLDAHRLITTEVYVVPPQYARICDLRVTVQPAPGFSRALLQDALSAFVATYLHVFTGGDDGTGFGFGGQLHIADLTSRIARHEGVDRVEDVHASFTRTGSGSVPRQGTLRACPAAGDEYESIRLAADETVSFDIESTLVTTVVVA